MFLLPLDGMLVHYRVTYPPPPPLNFTGNHFYTWVEIGTVTVKCLAQEQNKMSPAWDLFLESPGNFSGRKAIFSPSLSQNGEVYTPETSCMKGTFLHIGNM